jgi:hypothetical protein
MTSKKEIDALHPSEKEFNTLKSPIHTILAEAEKALGIKEKTATEWLDPSERLPDVDRLIPLDE